MKKLMKHIALMLAIVVFASFNLVGCDIISNIIPGNSDGVKQEETLNDKTSAQVYQEVVDTIDGSGTNFTSVMDYDVAVSFEITNPETQEKHPLEMKLKLTDILKKDGDNLYEKTYVDSGTLDLSAFAPEGTPEEQTKMSLGVITNEITYVDGMLYLHTKDESFGSNESKLKVEISLQNILDRFDLENMTNPIYDFSDNAFDDVVFNINDKEDEVYFEIVLDGTEASKFSQNVLSESAAGATDVNIDKVYYKFFLDKDGKFDHVEVAFTVTMKITSLSMMFGNPDMIFTYDYKGTIEFKDVGTTVVSAPADASDYNSGMMN